MQEISDTLKTLPNKLISGAKLTNAEETLVYLIDTKPNNTELEQWIKDAKNLFPSLFEEMTS
jgi:hypothetical protein